MIWLIFMVVLVHFLFFYGPIISLCQKDSIILISLFVGVVGLYFSAVGVCVCVSVFCVCV